MSSIDQLYSTAASAAGGGGGMDAGAPTGGMDSVDPSAHITSADSGQDTPEDNMRRAIMFLQAAAEGEGEDDEFIAKILKLAAGAQDALAGLQKNNDAAMGITPQHKAVRRAMSQSRAPVGGAA